MQPAVGSQKHYLYEVTVTFHKLLLAISFPCEVTASLKRAHRKYPLKSNHMLDNQKFKCDFANSKITYQAVFSMEANSNPPFDFIPDTATVSLMLVTPKGNKSAGQFEIVPTNFLRETLDPQELKDVKSAVEKCPDKKAGIVYSLNVRRLKLLTPEEYKAEMAKNPDVTMEGGDASYMSQLGPSSSSFSRGGGTAVNTSSTAINSANKILTSDIRLDGNAKISTNPGSIPVPQPIGRPQIPMPIPVSQNRQPTQAPPVDQSRNLVPPPTQSSNDTSRDEPNSTRSGSKSRSKGNVTLSFERKPPTLAPSPGNPSAPQQAPPPVTGQPQTSYPQPVVQTPQTTHTPSQPDHRLNPPNHRPIEVTPFQTNGSAVNDHRTGTVESTKTQAVVSSEHRGTDVSGSAAVETAQLRAQVVQLKAQLEENGIKYQRDVGGLQKERTDLKAQMDKLYDERGQWNNTKRELLLKSDEVVSLKEQLLQLQGKHSGPHPDSVRLAQTLATLSAVQKDNDKLTRDIQQLEDDRRASKQTIQTLQERLKEQATAQSQREGSLAASYTTKIAALESQVVSLQSSLVSSRLTQSTVSAEKTAVAAQLSSLLSDKQSSSQHSQSLVSSLQHRVNELQLENEQLHTRILRLEDEKGDLEEKLLGRVRSIVTC